MKAVPKNLLREIFIDPLRNGADNIIKSWIVEVECIFAQRMIRRGHQLFAHYRRIWKEKELLLFLIRFRTQLGSQTKGFLLMSAPFLFDWNQERIGNNVIQEQMKEIDYVQRLQEGTLFCTVCHLRRVIDRRVEGINYCKCRQSNGRNPLTLDSWEPYLERDNIIIWRQDQGAGQYAYKVYGCYADVSAEDFFFVQTDVAYRQQWDKTALALDIIDTDQQRDSNCIVMYWEMLWPKLFANRDYVFKRRTVVDRKSHLMVIVNQSTKHPNCPVLPKNQRVNDYWSYMVIRPHTTFRKSGLEFVLTYYDNPGIVIPPTVTTWVARTHMPDFLNKLHLATIQYAAGKDLDMIHDDRFNDEQVESPVGALDYFWNFCPEPGFEYPPEPEIQVVTRSGGGEGGEESTEMKKDKGAIIDEQSESADQADVDTQEFAAKTEEKKVSWWTYLHPYYYFA